MRPIQSFAIGMVMAAIGVAAFFQITPVDRVIRLVSIGALGTVAIVAAMLFFITSFRDR